MMIARLATPLSVLLLQPLALALLPLLMAPQPALTLECLAEDADCMRRCRPGTIREPQTRVVERDCPRPIRWRMESHLRCWVGKVPKHPSELTVSGVTSTSAIISWALSAKWPNATKMHYECHLAKAIHLAIYFNKEALKPLMGSLPTAVRAVRVNGLRPGQTYNCFLWVKIHGVKGASALAKVQTLRGAPAFPVSNLQLSYSLLNDSIVLTWQTSRPRCDPVTGYKLHVSGSAERILGQKDDRFEISLDWWNQLVGTDSGLVNVTIAPINALGTGPETKASVMPPPYDDYHLSSSECESNEKVYTFENLPVERDSSKVCYREVFYQECTRRDP